MPNVAILGSTGSIGRNALEVLESLPDYRVFALSAAKNASALMEQAERFKPRMVGVFDPEAAQGVRANGFKVATGIEALVEMASHPEVDVVVISLVGAVGLLPLLAAIKAGKRIALANKEPMVMAGEILMKEAHRWKAQIIPVDSEPSAVFQCLQGEKGGVSRVFLTASGGPFYRYRGDFARITPRQALKHPNWKMGPKITIDSSTLMNKGFEAIEIKNLFGLKLSQIEIVIHPQSIVHSAVEFKDGSVLAQLGQPDMRLPIQYALTYPERSRRLVKPLDLYRLRSLDFDRPDFKRFPCLALAKEAALAGGSAPAVLNASNEIAVGAFLSGKISFPSIPKAVGKVLKMHRSSPNPGLAEIVEVDGWARSKTQEVIRFL